MISQQSARVILCMRMVAKSSVIAFHTLIFSMLFVFCVRLCYAGVVVVTDYSDYKLVDFIQGHRERSVMVPPSDKRDSVAILKDDGGFDEIFDLDKGTDTELDFAEKKYRVTEYPPDDPTGPESEFFKPTGKRRKVLGYWCEEYRADVDSAKFGKRTDIECISSEPPGAKEYIEYEKLAKSKILQRSEPVQAGLESPGYEPEGFVLWSQYEDYDGVHEGPDITLIKRAELSPSVFEPPPGFTKDKDR
jgi:hypothetical protein